MKQPRNSVGQPILHLDTFFDFSDKSYTYFLIRQYRKKKNVQDNYHVGEVIFLVVFVFEKLLLKRV